MGQILNLESFDNSNSVTPESHPEYMRGYLDGHAAGETTAAEAESGQLRSINDILEGARFTYSEARQAVLADLDAIFDATLTQFLPALATVALAETLHQHILKAAENGTSEQINLSVPPALLSICETIVSNSGVANFVIKPDPQIGDKAIWFNSEKQDLCVDFENALSAVQNAIQYLQTPLQGIARND